MCAPGSEPSPCRLQNSRRPDGCVCARQLTHPLPATKQPPLGRTCARPAVNPAPAGCETAAVRRDVCAPSSEPSPCRLRKSCRPEGRVSTRRARTACRTGYRTTGPAPPGGVSAQLSLTTRSTVPQPTPPEMTHHHHHHTRPPATTRPRPIIRAAHRHHDHRAVQPKPPPPPSPHRPNHTRHQRATHVREPTTTALTVIRVANGATTRSIPTTPPPRHGHRLRHHHP